MTLDAKTGGELHIVLARVKQLPLQDLPRLLGDLEEIRLTALTRLTTPAFISQEDTLLDVQTASKRLGVSDDYLYRHHQQYPFTRRIGRKLLFSSLGIDAYIRKKQH